MTVEELIKRLRKIKNKQAGVIYLVKKTPETGTETDSVDFISFDEDLSTVILF